MPRRIPILLPRPFVDKTMDIIETVFLKEGMIGHASGASKAGEAPLVADICPMTND